MDPAHMVELALGNGAPDDDAGALRHIAGCERCREELSLVTRVVTAARRVEEPDLPAAPPERVWRRIARELTGADATTAPSPATPPGGLPGTPAGPRPTGRSPAGRRRTTRPVLGLLAGFSIVWWWSRNRSGTASRVRRLTARPAG
ncbi:hypothetical protein ACFXAE_09040 [Streptomyces sp. NPDC059454]|uniref:hypothetical protein n=1 Tax=Streptomyces sp. NPDC059454 TaxID=3346836 RepID=UPI0036CD5107